MRNNRTAGNQYERDIVNELKAMGYDAVTSRSESKRMDDKGVDIISDFPFHIQCKNSQNNPDYSKLILSDKLPKDKPFCVFHKKTSKSSGGRFIKQGEFVLMDKETFYKLVRKEL